MREALFDILGPGALEELRVLDAYAGSGALGLEALSRGAAWVTFLESDEAVARMLRDNIRTLGVRDRCRVVRASADEAVGGPVAGGPFDLVLADPPYAGEGTGRFLGALAAGGNLAPGGRVVVERDRGAPVPEPGDAPFGLRRTARYGRTCLDFFA